MLNIFPIQYLDPYAFFLLRVSVSFVIFQLGFRHWQYRHELASVFTVSWLPAATGKYVAIIFPLFEIGIAGFLLFGAYTQIAALLLSAMSLKLIIVRPWFAHPAIPRRMFYFLLFAVGLTLFITGAGYFAFDLPI